MSTVFSPKDMMSGTTKVEKDTLRKKQKADEAARKKRRPDVDKLCSQIWDAGIQQKFDGVNVAKITFDVPSGTDVEVKKDAEIRLTEQGWLVSGDNTWVLEPKPSVPSKRCLLKPWTWFRR